jgi:NAD(P)-dependent dehydrogenase (short-subunit alcohol dehydrogenase family)
VTASDAPRRFDGQLAVLTGVAHKGQAGEVVARVLGERGAALALIDRTAAEVDARAAELRALGIRATAYACDLTDHESLGTVTRRIAETHGEGVAALVCLAGGFALSGPVADSDPEVWRRQADINLTTAYLTTRAFLPQLRAARGAIVYFASASVMPGGRAANAAAYAAAKSGVVTLMRAVAQEERDSGVRSNALAPTAIRTATNVQSMSEATRYVERETVAEWVAFLCSPASGPVSGQLIQLG